MAINRDGTGNTNLHVTGFELDEKNSVPTRIQVMDKDGYLRWLACTDVDEAGIPVLHIEYPGVYGFQGGRIEASYTGVMNVEPLDITDPNQIVEVPSDVKYDPITVNIPVDTQTLSLTLVPSDGTISHDEGYIGFDEVTVNIPYFTENIVNNTLFRDPYANDSLYYSVYYRFNERINNGVKILSSPMLAVTGMAPSITVTSDIRSAGSPTYENRLVFYRKCGETHATFGFNTDKRGDMSTYIYDSPAWFPVSGGTARYETDGLDYLTYGMEVAKNQPYGLSVWFDPSTISGRLSDIFNIPHKRLYNLAQSLYLTGVTWGIQNIFITGQGVDWSKETITHLYVDVDAQYSQEDTLYTGFIRNFPHLMAIDIGTNVRTIQQNAIGAINYSGNANLQVITFLHYHEEDLPTIATGGIPQDVRVVYFDEAVVEAARTKYASLAWASKIQTKPDSWWRRLGTNISPGGRLLFDFKTIGIIPEPVT